MLILLRIPAKYDELFTLLSIFAMQCVGNSLVSFGLDVMTRFVPVQVLQDITYILKPAILY